MWTSSDHVLLKIKLSKCVQSNRPISPSHRVIRFNTKINYQAMGQVYQMFADSSQGTSVSPPTISADSATTPQLLVSFRVTLAWTCLLSTESNAPVFPAPCCPKPPWVNDLSPESDGEWELPDSSEMKDGADAWRGIIIAGTGRLPMGVLAQNLCSLHSMAQFLGELLFFLARHCYHLLPKHHLARVPRAPWEGQNLRTNTKLVSSRLPATN